MTTTQSPITTIKCDHPHLRGTPFCLPCTAIIIEMGKVLDSRLDAFYAADAEEAA